MKIIISPAKKMTIDSYASLPMTIPENIEKSRIILKTLQSMSKSQLKILWKCSDKILNENIELLKKASNLESGLTPAILAYDGIQYQYIAPNTLTSPAWDYIKDNLKILSGLYGCLNALDGVYPYRLEMQSKLAIGDIKDLYSYWSDDIYKSLYSNNSIVINLASKEYSKCIEKYLQKDDCFITCIFAEKSPANKLIQKGIYAKMARGEMVNFLANNLYSNPEDLKKFTGLGFSFSKELSSEIEYVFLRSTHE